MIELDLQDVVQLSPVMIAALASAAFFAGLVDSMAGGGGLISLPALLAAGVSPHFALGTNKIQSCIGTTFSAGRYLNRGRLHLQTAILAAAGAFLGSFAGSRAVLALPAERLSVIIPPLIVVVAAVTFLRRDFGENDSFESLTPATSWLALATGLVVGFYDGFFGPGTGTFLAFIFVWLFGFGFVRATGNAKMANLASNLAAAAAFSLSQKVLWHVAIPMALANIAGNWMGAGMAIRGGARAIKPVFGLVLAGLFVKMLFFR